MTLSDLQKIFQEDQKRLQEQSLSPEQRERAREIEKVLKAQIRIDESEKRGLTKNSELEKAKKVIKDSGITTSEIKRLVKQEENKSWAQEFKAALTKEIDEALGVKTKKESKKKDTEVEKADKDKDQEKSKNEELKKNKDREEKELKKRAASAINAEDRLDATRVAQPLAKGHASLDEQKEAKQKLMQSIRDSAKVSDGFGSPPKTPVEAQIAAEMQKERSGPSMNELQRLYRKSDE